MNVSRMVDLRWVLVVSVVLVGCGTTPATTSPMSVPAATRAPTDAPAAASAAGPTVVPAPVATLLPPEDPPAGAREFTTDFSKHTVPYREILSGGPPKDGIPAIDKPQFVSIAAADEWLKPNEPVILFEASGEARAYPIQILIWHEIVNDTVGGVPITVTFCPLCNTAIAFERTVDGRVLDFGTTGRLRFSNLIMYDRQTETWWQQASGAAIAGELTGTQLVFRPAAIIAWSDFKTAHPSGKVLSRDTGFQRAYGQNPYSGYDDVNSSPFLYQGPQTPGTLPAVARVLTVDLGGEAVAYPYDVLQKVRVVNDTVGGTDVVVLWAPGTASALDDSAVAGGRDVGAVNAYVRALDGQRLTFVLEGERIVDAETGSTWNVLGQAIAGKLAGKTLEPVVAINHFWFSWTAFKPETRVYEP
jgi:hypothetical protein